MGTGQIFRVSAKSIVLLGLVVTSSHGQEKPKETGPVYRVGVEQGIAAVTYPYGSAPTKIDFKGTALLPEAKGVAIVRSGHTEIDATFEKLPPPTHFGWQYPAYVLWAITPEGACHNLGELTLQESDHARLQATTDLQTFALIVTAEPYSIVRQPSTMVVLQNQVRADSASRAVPVEPNPALTPGVEYTWQAAPPPEETAKASMSSDRAVRELHQAANAVTIAGLAGADRFAPEPFASAQRALAKAQDLYGAKGDPKLVIQNARDAVQRADGARSISERRRQGGPAGNGDVALAEAAGAGSHSETNQEPLHPELSSRLHQQVDGILLTQDTQRGLIITLPDTAFDGGSLLTSIIQKLGPLVSALQSQPVHIEVQGYMDSAELASWERAQAVRGALVSAGLSGNEISMRGGMTSPARPGEDRRVQIVITSEAPAVQNTAPSVTGNVAPPVTGALPAVPANPEPARVAPVPAPPTASVASATPPPAPPAPAAPAIPAQSPAPTLVSQAGPPEVAPQIPAPQAAREVPAPTAPSEVSPAKAAAGHHARGRKLIQEEQFEEAIRELTDAVTLNPTLAQAYNARGYAYYRLKNYQTAVGDFDTAIRVDPLYANAYLNRSACRRALGDKAGAAADAAKARDLTTTTTARSANSGSASGL